MDYKQLEDAMDKMARGITTFKGASKFLDSPLTSLSKKVDPHNVLLGKEEVIIVDQILGMQACGLLITLEQLKFKVAKLT